MAIEPVSFGTLVAVAGGVFAYVLRERSKSKNEKINNCDIKEIKKTTKENQKCLASMDKSLGIVATNVENMQKHCGETTERFAAEIKENRGDIKGMLKGKR